MINESKILDTLVDGENEFVNKNIESGDMETLDNDLGEEMETLDTSENGNKKKNGPEFNKPKRNATKVEQRKMFGKALEIMLITCMNNHVYQFENKVRVQKQGGPIGLKLTGEIADCLMIDWDKKLLIELKKLKMEPEVYGRFKDDIDLVIERLEKGSSEWRNSY